MQINPYALESILSQAVTAILGDIGMPVYTRYGVERDMESERVEVQALAFEQASDQMNFRVGVPYFSHFRGMIEIEVLTKRLQSTVTNHDVVISLIRHALSQYASRLNASVLPDYEVHRVTNTATTTTLENDMGAEVTQLSFEIEVSILPTAFSVT